MVLTRARDQRTIQRGLGGETAAGEDFFTARDGVGVMDRLWSKKPVTVVAGFFILG